ncbi:hypothetical protein FH972_021320 [Carpinus fangiana]|uniref:Aminotransferase class V domain-containing protein n=1 Tax=Carpinus fangiana TaxID=176857 RepID=A0A5N6KPE2_9ROSI|nr:hypothetical protein FH972_021320 [Carpinus fangiana]
MEAAKRFSQLSLAPTPFGKRTREHFSTDKDWHPLNHGSFGTFPKPVKDALCYYQDLCEKQPDSFFRYHLPELVLRARTAVAKVVNAPRETVVFVSNATTGINTVLRNLTWTPRDHVIMFSTIYGACGNTVLSIAEQHPLQVTRIQVNYPQSDQVLLDAFEAAVAEIKAKGDNPKLAIFDTIVSLPGVRVPFEALTAACHRLGVLSCIDGAHGIGMIPLDLSALDPDFFVTNAHKWLMVPRGCCVMYVPVRNQHLIRTTLPTSHGYQPLDADEAQTPAALRVGEGQSQFENNFDFVGTKDACPYLCIPEALAFREQACGGEAAVMRYCSDLADKGGAKVAEILGTEVMENAEGTLNKGLALVNVRLPLDPAQVDVSLKGGHHAVGVWIIEEQMKRFKTYAPCLWHADKWWIRLSAQVYLDESDFEYIGGVMKTLCEEVRAGRHIQASH